jgi:hypothetical protein
MIEVLLIDWPGNGGQNMAGQDELAQLEAERDRLLSMMDYHNRRFSQLPPGRAPVWFVVVAMGIICIIGISIIAGVLAGQIPASPVLFLIVGLPLLAYISTRKITVFGRTFFMVEMLGLFFGDGTFLGGRAGETEARQRLADCEARIMKLKEGRR